MGKLLIPGVIVAVAVALSLFVNVFALVIFFRRKRLRIRAHLIPLFHLAAVDLLAVVTWSAVSVAIAVADWSPAPTICQAHAYFRSLWNMLHVHTFAVLAIERALRLVKPSLHVTIFVPRVVAFLLTGLWVFDVLVASIPHYGWLEFRLVENEMQCSPDFTDSIATLNFDFCVKWALPYLLLIAPCFALSFWKVWSARRNSSSSSCTGEIVLEAFPYTACHGYAERVMDFQSRFKQAGMKKAKPKLGEKVFTKQGYVTDSDSDVDDASGKELRAPQRVFSLARREYVLLKTYVIVSCVYFILWLPHVAVTFVVNRDPYAGVADWVVHLVTSLTHWAQVALPTIYLAYNVSFRRCVMKTLRCGGRRR